MGFTPLHAAYLHLNYSQPGNDIRHALRVVGTYDLPFGKDKMPLSRGGVINAIVGFWKLGTITNITTAGPTTFGGGYATVTNAASGIVLMNGTTVGQFQDSFKIQHTGACTASGCTGWVQEFTPYLAANGTADPNHLVYNNLRRMGPVIRGPISWTSDMSATKRVTVHEKYRF